MSPLALVGGAYALMAGVSLVIAARRGAAVGSLRGAQAALLIAVLWPLLLPGLVAEPAPIVREATRPRGPHAERLVALERALTTALDDAPSAVLLARPRSEIEAGVRRLEVDARRLEALDAAIAGALPAARPRLEALRARAEAQLGERLQLLEAVAAQLTVLRFVDLSAPEGAREEEQRVESLLAQLDALVAMSA